MNDNLKQRKEKAEAMEYDELLKYLDNYLEVAKGYYKSQQGIYDIITKRIIEHLCKSYMGSTVDKVKKAISKAVYKKDIVALYSIDMLLRHYDPRLNKCYGTYL